MMLKGQAKKDIYFIIDEASQAFKIGISSNPCARLSSLQEGNPNRLVMGETIKDATYNMERTLHQRYAKDRLKGEWFRYYKPGDKIETLQECGVVTWVVPEVDDAIQG